MRPTIRYGIYTTTEHTFWTEPEPLDDIPEDSSAKDLERIGLEMFDRVLRGRSFTFYDGLEYRLINTAHIVHVRVDVAIPTEDGATT